MSLPSLHSPLSLSAPDATERHARCAFRTTTTTTTSTSTSTTTATTSTTTAAATTTTTATNYY